MYTFTPGLLELISITNIMGVHLEAHKDGKFTLIEGDQKEFDDFILTQVSRKKISTVNRKAVEVSMIFFFINVAINKLGVHLISI